MSDFSNDDDEALRLDRRTGLPDRIAWLRARYPRPEWIGHLNYGQLAAFWQQVHDSLRSEGKTLLQLTSSFREGQLDAAAFQRRFAPQLGHHLQHLEGHHGIEDQHYFPRFRALDPRFGAGFDLLEQDHDLIHRELLQATASARELLHALQGTSSASQRAANGFGDDAERLLALLDRHLDDEEDLVIPAMLEHGERPLVAID